MIITDIANLLTFLQAFPPNTPLTFDDGLELLQGVEVNMTTDNEQLEAAGLDQHALTFQCPG